MSEAKFTNGPWQTSYRKNKKGMYSQDVYCEKGETICTCDWYPVDEGSGVTSTNRESNAYAIAVVPEMYDFIKKCSLAFADDYPSLRDSANALLAKARGEHE